MIRLDHKPQLFSFRVAALVMRNDHLLVHRSLTDSYWSLPGGRAEIGETSEQTLKREMREELGVEVGLGDELVGPDDGCWRLTETYTMRLWRAELVAGEPQPLVEHDALRWLPAGRWLTVPWLDADVRIVEALAASHRP